MVTEKKLRFDFRLSNKVRKNQKELKLPKRNIFTYLIIKKTIAKQKKISKITKIKNNNRIFLQVLMKNLKRKTFYGLTYFVIL